MRREAYSTFFRFWFPVLVYSGIIFYVSSLPGVKVPLSLPNFDKGLHILEYLPFGFLVLRALSHTKKTRERVFLLSITVGITFLYGASDEFHQLFVAGRESDFFDLLADTVGGAFGGSCYLYLKK